MNVLQELLEHAAQTLDTTAQGSREAAMRIAHDLREVPARLGFARSAGQVYPIADLLIEAGGLIRHDAPDTSPRAFRGR